MIKFGKNIKINVSPESQIVHQIDRLEMALQAKMYQKSGSSKENIATFLETARQLDITHPKLKEIFQSNFTKLIKIIICHQFFVTKLVCFKDKLCFNM